MVAGTAPTGPTLTGVHSPGIESPMIHFDSGIWFEGTGLDAWNAETDKIEAKNDSHGLKNGRATIRVESWKLDFGLLEAALEAADGRNRHASVIPQSFVV